VPLSRLQADLLVPALAGHRLGGGKVGCRIAHDETAELNLLAREAVARTRSR
jgi:hypothetical protein